MSITKNWSIISLLTRPSLNGMEDVVISVEWSIKAVYTDDYGRLLSESGTRGQTYIEFPEENFTSFSNLTEAQVLEWVKRALGAKATEYEIDTVRHAIGLVHPENTVAVQLIEKDQLPWAQ